MDNTLLYIFIFLYLIFMFFVTFYCYGGHLCFSDKKESTRTHNEEINIINNYEDDIF